MVPDVAERKKAESSLFLLPATGYRRGEASRRTQRSHMRRLRRRLQRHFERYAVNLSWLGRDERRRTASLAAAGDRCGRSDASRLADTSRHPSETRSELGCDRYRARRLSAGGLGAVFLICQLWPISVASTFRVHNIAQHSQDSVIFLLLDKLARRFDHGAAGVDTER